MVRIEHYELASPRAVALYLGTGSTIRVSSGRLWLTVQGQPQDVWLQAGEGFTLGSAGTAWLSAEPAAQFQVAWSVRQPWRWSAAASPGLWRVICALPPRFAARHAALNGA
jgi:hypothetical protein